MNLKNIKMEDKIKKLKYLEMNILEDKVRIIIKDEFNGRIQTYSDKIVGMEFTNHCIKTALLILNILKINDFKITINLAKIIQKHRPLEWTQDSEDIIIIEIRQMLHDLRYSKTWTL